MLRMVTTCVLLFISPIASADCVLNGSLYPTGAVVNNYLCLADGNWVYRQ